MCGMHDHLNLVAIERAFRCAISDVSKDRVTNRKRRWCFQFQQLGKRSAETARIQYESGSEFAFVTRSIARVYANRLIRDTHSGDSHFVANIHTLPGRFVGQQFVEGGPLHLKGRRATVRELIAEIEIAVLIVADEGSAIL